MKLNEFQEVARHIAKDDRGNLYELVETQRIIDTFTMKNGPTFDLGGKRFYWIENHEVEEIDGSLVFIDDNGTRIPIEIIRKIS